MKARHRFSWFAVTSAICWMALAPGAQAQCLAQDMEGTWHDPFGAIKKLHIGFTCCDTVSNVPGQPPPPPCPAAEITAWGPCPKLFGICSWGKTPATYDFVSYDGSPQTSRLDAVYADEGDTRRLVILKVSPEELLVFMSVEFPADSTEHQFSTLQTFRNDTSCRYWRGTVVCRDPQLRELHMRELAPE